MSTKSNKNRKKAARRSASHRGASKAIGRPTEFIPSFCEDAKKLCLLGATDDDLADFFGIAKKTVYAWQEKYPEFSHSIKAGKARADAEVAHSLFFRARGYEHKAVKIFADAKTGSQHVVDYTERYPPDTVAGIFWLKNRRPDLWRDKQDFEHSNPPGRPIETKSTVTLTPDKAYLALIGKQNL